MQKRSKRGTKAKVKELEPFNKRTVDAERFKPDVPEKKFATLFGFPGGISLDFLTIDFLGIPRTVGKGRTNLTFIRPTIVQADAATPSRASTSASRRTASRPSRCTSSRPHTGSPAARASS